MIKILIVDDEPLFREFLLQTINWSKYGFEVIGEAKNGVEALQLASELYPDIVLTDINMPLMDGLKLTEKLNELNPDIGVILISGHSEFEYAQKAVKLGVADYILKPFQKEELLMTLLRFKDTVKQTHEITSTDKSNTELLVSGIMYNLLFQQNIFNEEEIDTELSSLGIYVKHKNFVVASISIDDVIEEEDKMIWQFAVSNMLHEYIKIGENIFNLNDYQGNVVSILEIESNIDYKNVIKAYDRFKDLVSKHLHFTVSIGIGTVHTNYSQIRSSYYESITALNQKYTSGKNKLHLYDSISKEKNDMSFYNIEINESLLRCLREKNIKNTNEVLDAMFVNMSENMLDADYIKVIHMGLLSQLLSFVTQSGKIIEDIMGTQFSPYQELENIKTFKEQQSWIKNVYTKTIEYLNKHKKTRSYEVANSAKEYIDKNYTNNKMTVADIAASQFINQTYLRSMFKKELGMTVSDYITKVRMEKAKDFLTNNYKLSHIAELVGYSDASYLSKTFKKYYGVAPRNYNV